MRKDITIPEVKEVYIAAVLEFNKKYNTTDWNAYIINNNKVPLETVIIVSQGYDDKDLTAPMRHTIKSIPAQGYARIEFLEESILRLDNFFSVTYFIGNTLYDKRFELPANSVIEDNRVDLPVMEQQGVLAR